ncbi:MAG: hypothetical protein U9O89_02255 [Thermoproteota archaeon]|nr:hypothetical protein [Thermoproteota archaeon]
MPVKKIRVEVLDGDGSRYVITLKGRITREKAVRILDLVELLGGVSGGGIHSEIELSELSKFNQVKSIIEKHFSVVWFSSKELQSMYEKQLKRPISLSTVSTYLSRMVDRGFLMRETGKGNLFYYRMMTRLSQRALNFAKGDK